nr:hypothetical protein [Paenibacillus sp. PCH8]
MAVPGQPLPPGLQAPPSAAGLARAAPHVRAAAQGPPEAPRVLQAVQEQPPASPRRSPARVRARCPAHVLACPAAALQVPPQVAGSRSLPAIPSPPGDMLRNSTYALQMPPLPLLPVRPAHTSVPDQTTPHVVLSWMYALPSRVRMQFSIGQ